MKDNLALSGLSKNMRKALMLCFMALNMVPAAWSQKLTADQTQAIKWWNEAREDIIKGDYVEAEKLLRQSDRLYPHMSRIENMWGLALVKTGKVEEGLRQLLLATSDPSVTPAAYVNLGLAYEANGNLPKAIEADQKFLQLEPQAPEAPRVRVYLATLIAGLKAMREGNASDYFAEATATHKMCWQSDKMPVKVFITSGVKVPGYRPSFSAIVKESLADWQKASGNSLTFVSVASATEADINIRFTNDLKQLSNQAEAGEAKYIGRPPALKHVDVLLLTMYENHQGKVTDNSFGWVARHELGHALGLLGHSPNTADVMCFLEGQVDKPAQLTQRDANTIKRLYSGK